VSYTTTELPLFSLSAVSNAPKLSVYDSLDAEVIQSYLEFSIASLLFYAMKEGACSEQSSRMTAMDNASKNAGKIWRRNEPIFHNIEYIKIITKECHMVYHCGRAIKDVNTIHRKQIYNYPGK
jgi:F0F1-type ATP synthase gamma subunit